MLGVSLVFGVVMLCIPAGRSKNRNDSFEVSGVVKRAKRVLRRGFSTLFFLNWRMLLSGGTV
jgi:hypothetical protein